MSRNAESRFAVNPTNINISRSRFNRNSSVKTSFNVGDVVPFYVDEVLPGDTFKVKTNKVVRMQTLITPVMDNIYLDTYYFFVPNRLVWKHWKEFMGENNQSAWLPSVTYSVPQIVSPASNGWTVGTIADYLGIPIGVPGLSVNALPFRAYALIMNEWFRDENLSAPLVIPDGDTTVTGVNSGTFVTDVAKGGLPYTAAKYHDYFTSALPAPQKGPDVTIPVATQDNLPVMALNEWAVPSDLSGSSAVSLVVSNYQNSARKNREIDSWYSAPGNPVTSISSMTPLTSSDLSGMTPMNLWAVQSGAAAAATINQLRMAFQIQKWYEKAARGGTRYIETLKAHFGVTSPDSRLQRPEYLGGNRVPININQVIQQSETGSTPMGSTGAFSLTTDRHSDFTRSFTEHGFVIGVMVARYDHTYQQGVERFWRRKSMFDYYWPEFANIGEQAITNVEIYAQSDSTVDSDGNVINDQVFGYQEAFGDYRMKPSRVCAEMRSAATTSLDVWHLADNYASMPYLSDAWIREDKTNVDRVLAVQSSVSNQLFADIFIQNITTRAMPMYSIPGLIDHH